MEYIESRKYDLAEFAEVASANYVKHGDSNMKGSERWTNSKSFREAFEMLFNGGISDLKTLTAQVDAVTSKIEETTLTATYGVAGDFVDVGRFIEGEPECMVSFDWEKDDSDKYIEIVCDTVESFSVEKAQIERRTIAMASVISVLETMGYKVKVWVSLFVNGVYKDRSNGRKRARYRDVRDMILIKDFDQVMSINQMAYAFSADFFRRLGFAILENSKGVRGIPCSLDFTLEKGYGYVVYSRSTAIKDIRKYFPEISPDFKHFPSIGNGDHLFDSDEDIVKYVERTVKELAY